ncbi:MAG: 2-hydroxyacyl-CoA dehydratase, partial [Deltaproteobacteria bacterium]|nr:2-hydroxyacyl-CoA dehydratase [Deltaproteobacteria bacterium]
RQSPGSHEEDLENRFGHIYKLASDFDVKGVIFHILQYCDTHAFDIHDLKEYVEGKGFPVLLIEEDYPISSIARLKTRVEAFLEMMD